MLERCRLALCVALVALTVVLFPIAYVAFLRQEVRAWSASCRFGTSILIKSSIHAPGD